MANKAPQRPSIPGCRIPGRVSVGLGRYSWNGPLNLANYRPKPMLGSLGATGIWGLVATQQRIARLKKADSASDQHDTPAGTEASMPLHNRAPGKAVVSPTRQSYSRLSRMGGARAAPGASPALANDGASCAGAPHFEKVYLLPSAVSRFEKGAARLDRGWLGPLGHERVVKEPGTGGALSQRYSGSELHQQRAVIAAERAQAATDAAATEVQREKRVAINQRKHQRLTVLRARLLGDHASRCRSPLRL